MIEVVAGLAITGSVLVAVVLAQGRFVAQMRRAQEKQEAVAAADALLEGWWADLDHFPVGDRGDVDAQLAWETQAVPQAELEQVGLQQVRVLILSRQAGEAAAAPPPLVSLDVIVPAPPNPRAKS